jgi:hypothetical protein
MYAKPVPTVIQFFDSSNINLGRRRLLRNSRNYYKNPPEGNYKKYYANLKVEKSKFLFSVEFDLIFWGVNPEVGRNSFRYLKKNVSINHF